MFDCRVAQSKAVRLASSMPCITGPSHNKTPPSAFSSPPLTRINTTGMNVRDSVLTQESYLTHQSGTSSSLYPPSTSTASGTESPPSPRSVAEQNDNNDVSSFDPEVDDPQEFDGDDVSYRLRLLVKNNYFLPPAHSKPSPSDFATLNAPKKPARVTTPTFLDLFRVGKSRSKPTTPTGATQTFDSLTPVLRTTSDSTTASGYAPRPQPRSSSQIVRLSPHPGSSPQDRAGRVVVVREKMSDLVSAAKQAELDMKARGVRRDPGSQRGQQGDFDDVIDPTDAVDLPLPSSTYPFAVQASALHGLGVQDSVGAALLAERLPPPTGPSMSFDQDDGAWRKALLHEAVGHSLDNSLDVSSLSVMVGGASTPTPLTSPQITNPGTPSSQIRSPSMKRLLGQRIISQPMIEPNDEPQPQLSQKKSTHPGGGLTSPASYVSKSRPPSFLPLRAETPCGPQTPLAPAPRRQIINPLYSLSQTDLPGDEQRQSSMSRGPSSTPVLRKAVSSPMLSDAYESGIRHAMVITPPPLPTLTMYSQASSMELSGSSSFETSREGALRSVATSESHYSDGDGMDAERVPRVSMTLSVPTDGRPSLSEYSQPSPAASAFHDALNNEGYHSASSSFHQQSQVSLDQQVAATRVDPPRYSATSPPPRVSSSLANIALSPPPRTSSLHYKATSRKPTSTSSSDPGHSSNSIPSDPTLQQILAPEPVTPPFPSSERRGNTMALSLSLNTQTGNVPVSIHSAPPPSSPTSFFDTIQTQPNAMDDLDSSSDESDDDVSDSRGPTSLFVDPRTRAISNIPATTPRPSIMRLGNHSTPYIARPHRPSLPFGVADPKKPIGNVPVKAPFFSDKRSGKSDQGHGPPSSTFDFYQYTQQHPAATTGGSSVTNQANAWRRPAPEGVRAWQSNQRAQESLRRLDGMLIQHMEAEKDTIKRIATTFYSKT